MRCEQLRSIEGCWPASALDDADLVLVFGQRRDLETGLVEELRARYSSSHLIGCSTSGEIYGDEVCDAPAIATAVKFDDSRVDLKTTEIAAMEDSYKAGCRLAASLFPLGLVHVFALSDGLGVNGSDLVRGLMDTLPEGVTVTGGLAGDGGDFEHTLVLADEQCREGIVAACGFYGDRLKVGYGSLGGWDPFGPERLVTRSRGNLLYDLDGRSALALYQKYLGDQAEGLPATGLLFPLAVRTGDDEPVVRTILAVDEDDQSMTFAGDVPEGSYARLMRANFNRLIDGAGGAARTGVGSLGSDGAALAVLISCVGRRMILKQRTEEEIDAVREVIGADAMMAGFYSYGEISPFTQGGRCTLHNQTMTITLFSEFADGS